MPLCLAERGISTSWQCFGPVLHSISGCSFNGSIFIQVLKEIRGYYEMRRLLLTFSLLTASAR